MTKKSNKLIIIFLGLFLLTSVNLTILNQGRIDPVSTINKDDMILETSDIIYHPFIVGVNGDPVTIDPVKCWDSRSWNVIDQVCEGLFRNNLSDPDLPRINWLAESYWWEDTTTLHLKLREGVLFHDNTPFNSTAAKWNLDRINYFINASGTLPASTPEANPSILWRFPNGTALMKQIDYVSLYNLTVHLNGPYSPFLDLLCATCASMISPTSHSQTDYIDLITGDLVGTGPFEYDNFTSDVEVNFRAFDNYWRGIANISDMKYQIISDSNARSNAMLTGVIDYLYSPSSAYYTSLKADPDILFEEAPSSGFTYYFLGFNNDRINITWRKSISYAINYSYIIHEMRASYAERAYSPIAPGYGGSYYNCSNIAAYYNLTIARQTLIDDPGIDTSGLTANDNPDDTAWEAANLATFNYSHVPWGFWSDLYPALVEWCDNIGITVLENIVPDWMSWIDLVENNKHKLSLFSSGWGPDYLDPYNMLGPLFSNTSITNWCSVNDPWLQSKLEEAVITMNDAARNTIYHDIQIYLSSSLYPQVFLFYQQIYFVYNVNLTHYPHNDLGRLYFYPCKWIPKYTVITEPPPDITIIYPTPNQGYGDIAPAFSLTINATTLDTIWYTLDDGVTNFTCTITDQVNSSFWDGLSDDTYTLRFYANSSAGVIGSAQVQIYKDTNDPIVVINDPDPGDEFNTTIPSYDITIIEDHFSMAWYTMDNGITVIPIIGTIGSIDAGEWNALPNGQVTIIFYAMDEVGNIGFSSVVVTKNTPSTDEEIPGFYPVLIITILLVGILNLAWRQKRKLI